MVFSLLLVSVSSAAEPQVLWSPGLPELGHKALVAGEFDGHAGLDWAASFQNGEGSGIALRLSGVGEDWQISTEQVFTELHLSSANVDGDSEEELLVGLPELPSTLLRRAVPLFQ